MKVPFALIFKRDFDKVHLIHHYANDGKEIPMNYDTFFFGPGLDAALVTFRDSTKSGFPFRDLLIELWEKGWYGLDKVGLATIRIIPHQEPNEHILSFQFREDSVFMKESEVRTVDDILRLIARGSLNDKSRAKQVLQKIQARVTALGNVHNQALSQMVIREVEWRANLLPNCLAQATVVTYGELIILYEKGSKKCYVVENALSILNIHDDGKGRRITVVPVDVSVVPQVQPILDFLQTSTFEELYQIRGMPVA